MANVKRGDANVSVSVREGRYVLEDRIGNGSYGEIYKGVCFFVFLFLFSNIVCLKFIIFLDYSTRHQEKDICRS